LENLGSKSQIADGKPKESIMQSLGFLLGISIFEEKANTAAGKQKQYLESQQSKVRNAVAY